MTWRAALSRTTSPLPTTPLRDRYHRIIRRKTRSSLHAGLHDDLSHKQLRSLLCAQLSAVQAAADPDVGSPGSLYCWSCDGASSPPAPDATTPGTTGTAA